MSGKYPWLPDLVLFQAYGGDWERYQETLYRHFVADFVTSSPRFRGQKLGLKRQPVNQGKEATFWHFISEGSIETERLPDLRRCERIRWPRPGIDNCDADAIKVWESEVRGETRISIWLEAADYVIILARRRGYLLPWTAFVVDQEHRRKKLLKQYSDCQKRGQRAP